MTDLIEKYKRPLATLRKAYRDDNLTLYLGAGVSVDSGIPSWEQLVAAMYFSALARDHDQYALTHAFRNYLLAIAQWYLDRAREPMDITARKIRAFHDGMGRREFLVHLRSTLYASMIADPDDTYVGDTPEILSRNGTLAALAELCATPAGIAAVITYNYDNLLELALEGRRRCQAIWQARQRRRTGQLPCYHVHGYIPYDPNQRGSAANQIIFTEEQFHAAANTAYAWSNVVQLQRMAGSVGLTVGLSLSDRNMRRLLDAASGTPLRPRLFAVMKKPVPARLLKSDQRRISKLARECLGRFTERARMKTEHREFGQVRSIVEAVEQADQLWQEKILGELGVEVLWIDDFAQLTQLTRAIAA